MSQITTDAATGIGRRAKHLWQGLGMGLALTAMLLLGLSSTASAADRTVQLKLDASTAACTAWDQMDCSYLEARNGNAPAPDPQEDAEPTFLNLALLPAPVTIDATLHDDGTVTIPQGSVNFPTYPTTLDNDLVGEVSIGISINQTGDWTGTFDDGTGEMSLTAPLGLEFDVSCDPGSPTLCDGVFPANPNSPAGNMGTWQVDTTGPVDPLTTGNLPAPTPPAAYGPDWLGPVVEDGSPLDSGTGAITLINNDLVINPLDENSCIDPTSVACNNPGVAGLLLPALNGALGTSDEADPGPPAFMDSQPGAIDMRLAMIMTEPPIIEANPDAVAFTGMNDDGTQPLGTSSRPETITLSVFDLGDVVIESLYTHGDDDADFGVTSAAGCRGGVAAGEDCAIKLRFNPSETGARSSTLFAKVVNPISGESETHQLATLTGDGGVLPAGPQGPQGPQGNPGANGPLVGFASASRRIVPANGRAAIATVMTRGAAVRVRAQKKVAVRIRGRRVVARVAAPNRVNAGKAGKIQVRLPRGAVRLLRGTQAKVKVKLKVKAANGRLLNLAAHSRLYR